MVEMSAWVVSLLGIVVITLVCDVILPQGQTAKYVKTVISLVVVCSIVFPLVKMLSGFDWSFTFEQTSVVYQDSYLDYIRVQKEDSLSASCEKVLNDNGIFDCSVVVCLDANFDAQSVVVYLPKDCLDSSLEDEIIKLLLTVVSVDRRCVSCVDKR